MSFSSGYRYRHAAQCGLSQSIPQTVFLFTTQTHVLLLLQGTFRESRPFGSIHKRFSCTRAGGECSIPAPLSICSSDLVLGGQCFRSTPLRQAGLLHCWRCRIMGDFSRHMSIVYAQLLTHLANKEIHQSTTCLLEISRGWLLFEGGYAGEDFFLTL